METVGTLARSGKHPRTSRIPRSAKQRGQKQAATPVPRRWGGRRQILAVGARCGKAPGSQRQGRLSHSRRRIHDSTNRGQRVTSWSVSRNP